MAPARGIRDEHDYRAECRRAALGRADATTSRYGDATKRGKQQTIRGARTAQKQEREASPADQADALICTNDNKSQD
jgi:hypothetical protein